jgi:hypothetical protein
MKENFDLKAKERFYEGLSREHIKAMSTEQVKAMERRVAAKHELLRTEIAYRERVDRIQA